MSEVVAGDWRCMYCGELLYTRNGVWLHCGGGQYIMRCGKCGLVFDAPAPLVPKRCKCGGVVYDDHCATPRRSP